MPFALVYGRPCLGVTDRKGTAVPYLIDGDGPGRWVLTSPKGDTYAVRLDPRGNVLCSCPGHRYRGRCKHKRAVTLWLSDAPDAHPGGPADGTQVDRRTGPRLAGDDGHGATDPALGEDHRAADRGGRVPAGPPGH